MNEKATELSAIGKFLYKILDRLGLTSGITIVAIGVVFIVWFLINNDLEQVLLSAVLVALGVIVMERHKFNLD
jgi:hypothetical protein